MSGLTSCARMRSRKAWRANSGVIAVLLIEASAQPLFESRNIARNLIRSQHDLMTLGVERVEGMKEFLLGALAAGQELDVVKNQGVDAAELFLELAHPVASQRADELVHENLGRHEQYFACARASGP